MSSAWSVAFGAAWGAAWGSSEAATTSHPNGGESKRRLTRDNQRRRYVPIAAPLAGPFEDPRPVEEDEALFIHLGA